MSDYLRRVVARRLYSAAAAAVPRAADPLEDAVGGDPFDPVVDPPSAAGPVGPEPIEPVTGRPGSPEPVSLEPGPDMVRPLEPRPRAAGAREAATVGTAAVPRFARPGEPAGSPLMLPDDLSPVPTVPHGRLMRDGTPVHRAPRRAAGSGRALDAAGGPPAEAESAAAPPHRPLASSRPATGNTEDAEPPAASRPGPRPAPAAPERLVPSDPPPSPPPSRRPAAGVHIGRIDVEVLPESTPASPAARPRTPGPAARPAASPPRLRYGLGQL